jgi:hypothetical protein
MKKFAESTPLRSRAAMAVWNAWCRKDGGFISAGARSAGTSDAATVPQPARIQACRGNGASNYCQLRAGRGLVLRLREAGDDRGCGIASAAFASEKSVRTWTAGKSACRLGIATELGSRRWPRTQSR